VHEHAAAADAAGSFTRLADGPPDATNAGRVQSIAVSPTDANRSIIAMQFGELWRTFNNGATWFRVYTLPNVFVTDVEFGSDGKTVVGRCSVTTAR
jgi:hypothetical protein